ncbi:MAG: hypothetical protein GEU97_15620 [Actinophytocola sp.]|nr:hypothetical protein [Actinophytocola sp.]
MPPVAAIRVDTSYLASRHRVAPFTLHRPATASEAGELLQRYGSHAVAMGGGVDLSNRLKLGERVDHVAYLRGAADLTRIEQDTGSLRVGAAVTHQEFANHTLVKRALPDLAAVWRRLGNPRVRACGTLGGNLITADAHYDVAALLAATGARLIYSPATQRLLTHIEFPADARVVLRYETAYKPAASVAIALSDRGAGTWRVRIVVGCAYPEPAVGECVGSAGGGAELAHALVRGLPEPVDDHVASAAYRRRLITVIARRLVADLAAGRDDDEVAL